MKIAIVKERRAFERRVAASPDTVKQMKGLGLDVAVEAAPARAPFLSTARTRPPARRSLPTRPPRLPMPTSC